MIEKIIEVNDLTEVSRDYNEKLRGKVDAVEGKTLTSNDYTDEDKALVTDYGMQIADLFGLAERLEELI